MDGTTGSVETNAANRTLPPNLLAALNEVTEISSLPEITTRIVQVVEDPRATAHDMHEIVRTDPALAAKILKVVNSAFYGLPSQIASLDRAILLLGLSAVKNIALAASLSRMFNADAMCEQFAARDLWRHCVAVGVCAKMLASEGRCAQADEAFVAGLVHDMGLIVEQQLFPEKLRDVADRCYNEPLDFCEVERNIVGADHQAFGGTLAARWKFPPGLQAVISYHHDPDLVPSEFATVVKIVHIADILCAQQRYGLWLTAQGSPLDEDVLKTLNLSLAIAEKVIEELPDRVQEAERIFTD